MRIIVTPHITFNEFHLANHEKILAHCARSHVNKSLKQKKVIKNQYLQRISTISSPIMIIIKITA
jgi:hypothetical protein